MHLSVGIQAFKPNFGNIKEGVSWVRGSRHNLISLHVSFSCVYQFVADIRSKGLRTRIMWITFQISGLATLSHAVYQRPVLV